MLKKLFYASGAVLMLALAYHLGAVTAQAQGPGFRVIGENAPFVAVGNNVYRLDYSGWRPVPPGSGSNTLPPVPVSNLVLYLGSTAITQTGEGWVEDGNTHVWSSIGVVPGSPTPATQETWGGVKARYRPGASAAPQDK